MRRPVAQPRAGCIIFTTLGSRDTLGARSCLWIFVLGTCIAGYATGKEYARIQVDPAIARVCLPAVPEGIWDIAGTEVSMSTTLAPADIAFGLAAALLTASTFNASVTLRVRDGIGQLAAPADVDIQTWTSGSDPDVMQAIMGLNGHLSSIRISGSEYLVEQLNSSTVEAARSVWTQPSVSGRAANNTWPSPNAAPSFVGPATCGTGDHPLLTLFTSAHGPSICEDSGWLTAAGACCRRFASEVAFQEALLNWTDARLAFAVLHRAVNGYDTGASKRPAMSSLCHLSSLASLAADALGLRGLRFGTRMGGEAASVGDWALNPLVA